LPVRALSWRDDLSLLAKPVGVGSGGAGMGAAAGALGGRRPLPALWTEEALPRVMNAWNWAWEGGPAATPAPAGGGSERGWGVWMWRVEEGGPGILLRVLPSTLPMLLELLRAPAS
jgi:hypothetical protein